MISFGKIISLLLVLSIAYNPLFACDEDEHEEHGVRAQFTGEKTDEKEDSLKEQKKHKKKKKKDNKPDSFIRGDIPERGKPVLELD